jgi:hypothetical protein
MINLAHIDAQRLIRVRSCFKCRPQQAGIFCEDAGVYSPFQIASALANPIVSR